MAQGTPPTIKDQILAERAALEQQRQQGIEMAQSNLPTEYAGGGIVAFDDGGEVEHFDGGGSAFSEDLGRLKDWYKEKMAASAKGITEPMQDVKNYFTVPRQSPRDVDAQPGGLYGQPSGSNMPPAAPAAPVDNLTVDRSKPGPGTQPTSLLNKVTGGPDTKTDTGGIDEIIKQAIGDIKGLGKENAEARKDAKNMALLQAGLGIMGGTSPFAAVNFKGALPAAQAYQEEMRGIRGDEAKQLGQIAALNLKGAELKQELKKLGITEEYYRAHYPLLAAQAGYYTQRGAGVGGIGGAISSPTALKMRQDYKGFLANPASSPVFSSLDKQTQKFLTKADPSSASYQQAYQVFKNKLDNDFMSDVQFMRAVGNKRSDLSSLE
jgi:hypothetical protein